MQNLIDKISKMDEAAERVKERADSEKKRIEEEMQQKRRSYDALLEKETQKKLEEIRRACNLQSEQDLNRQRDEAAKVQKELTERFEKIHERLSTEIAERIVQAG